MSRSSTLRNHQKQIPECSRLISSKIVKVIACAAQSVLHVVHDLMLNSFHIYTNDSEGISTLMTYHQEGRCPWVPTTSPSDHPLRLSDADAPEIYSNMKITDLLRHFIKHIRGGNKETGRARRLRQFSEFGIGALHGESQQQANPAARTGSDRFWRSGMQIFMISFRRWHQTSGQWVTFRCSVPRPLIENAGDEWMETNTLYSHGTFPLQARIETVYLKYHQGWSSL